MLTEKPALGVLSGAVLIAFSGILFRKSHVSPATGAFFRCFWALPFLFALAIWEDGRLGRRPRQVRRAAWLAGAFFAADLILWHYSIDYVGAGLATVLGNTQVVLVGLLAWALFGERPARNALYAIPVAMLGILLISGVLESGAYGSNPRLGAIYGLLTGIAYSGFLLAMRRGSEERGRVAGPLYDATLASAICIVPIGLVHRRPGLHALARSHGLADPARAQLPGRGLAPDHGLARAAAHGAHLGAPDAPAAARGHLRRADRRRAALAAAAGRRRSHSRRSPDRLRGPA